MPTQSIHGHSVINLLDSDLLGLTPEQLLAFLIRKEKAYEQDGRLRVDRAWVCGGEHARASVEPEK